MTKKNKAKGKKKRKQFLQKVESTGTTSDLYMAYKDPEEKKKTIADSEVAESTSSSPNSNQVMVDVPVEDVALIEKDAGAKSEPDDWEDASDISKPKLETLDNGERVHHEKDGNKNTIKKYSRDFLLKLAEQFTDVPEDFKITADMAKVLMNHNVNPSHLVDRNSFPSPGRIIDRPGGPPQLDHLVEQARHNSFRGVHSLPTPSIPKQQSPRKDPVAVDQPNTRKASPVVPMVKKDNVLVSPAPPSSQTQKPCGLTMTQNSVPNLFHQPQVSVQFSGPNQPIPSQGVTASSLQMPQMAFNLPMGSAPQVQQPVFVSSLQSYPIPHQGIMLEVPNLSFTSHMAQMPPPLGISPRSGPNVPLPSQPIPSFAASPPINYYITPYNGDSLYYSNPSSHQAPRFVYPGSQGPQSVKIMNPPALNAQPGNKSSSHMHGILKQNLVSSVPSGTTQATSKPSAGSVGEKLKALSNNSTTVEKSEGHKQDISSLEVSSEHNSLQSVELVKQERQEFVLEETAKSIVIPPLETTKGLMDEPGSRCTEPDMVSDKVAENSSAKISSMDASSSRGDSTRNDEMSLSSSGRLDQQAAPAQAVEATKREGGSMESVSGGVSMENLGGSEVSVPAGSKDKPLPELSRKKSVAQEQVQASMLVVGDVSPGNPNEYLTARLVPDRFSGQPAYDQSSAQEQSINYGGRGLRSSGHSLDRSSSTQNTPTEKIWPEERHQDKSRTATKEFNRDLKMASQGGTNSGSRWINFHNKKCECGKNALLRISESKNNPNRLYYCCVNGENDCGFFEWWMPEDSAQPLDTMTEGPYSSEPLLYENQYPKLVQRIVALEANVSAGKTIILLNFVLSMFNIFIVICVLIFVCVLMKM